MNNIDIFYEWIDFLTLRIDRLHNSFSFTCLGIVENSPILVLDHGFRFIFLDIKRGWKIKILQLQDSKNNNLWEVRLVVKKDHKDFTLFDELEFTSTFFTMYPHYLDYFLLLFDIDTKKNKTISRIDYCIDIINYTTQECFNLSKMKPKKHFPVVQDMQYTYFRFENQRHKLVFYNKRLDTLDKNKHKLEDMYGNKPFKKYTIWDFPITRIEYRKNSQSFRDIENNFIDWVLSNIRTMAIQYTNIYLEFDLPSTPIPYNKKNIIKKDVIFQYEISRKSDLSLSRASSYLDSYRDLNTENEIFYFLEKKYWYRLLKYLESKWLREEQLFEVFPEHWLDIK